MNARLSKPTTVDTHFHLFDAGHAVPGARYTPGYDAQYAAWNALAAADGIARGVLVQTSFLGTDNSRLVQELRAHPEQLRGVAVVAPDVGADELAELHRNGVRGVRLNLAGRLSDLDAWRGAQATWDVLLRLGWHVELHTDIGALPVVLAQMPSALPLVVDHMGKPDAVRAGDATVQALRARASQGRVWIKLSGPYRLGGRDARALAQLWLGELGESRLLWGSDWPFTNHERDADYAALRRALDGWIDEPARMRILAHNPQALYWAD